MSQLVRFTDKVVIVTGAASGIGQAVLVRLVSEGAIAVGVDVLEPINVNLVGTFLFCREVLPHLIKTHGNIVNTASTSAFVGHPYMAGYSASKGAVVSLTRALAWEYIRQGVRVNAVAPSGIETPLAQAQQQRMEGLDRSLFQHMMRPDFVFGQPVQVASVIAMLASDDGAFMTGEVVKVDGGVHN